MMTELNLKSVGQPFNGDYCNLRRNSSWREVLKKSGFYKMDKRVVFADEAAKANRSNGKVEGWLGCRGCLASCICQVSFY
jgi:hypothetical protein